MQDPIAGLNPPRAYDSPQRSPLPPPSVLNYDRAAVYAIVDIVARPTLRADVPTILKSTVARVVALDSGVGLQNLQGWLQLRNRNGVPFWYWIHVKLEFLSPDFFSPNTPAMILSKSAAWPTVDFANDFYEMQLLRRWLNEVWLSVSNTARDVLMADLRARGIEVENQYDRGDDEDLYRLRLASVPHFSLIYLTYFEFECRLLVKYMAASQLDINGRVLKQLLLQSNPNGIPFWFYLSHCPKSYQNQDSDTTKGESLWQFGHMWQACVVTVDVENKWLKLQPTSALSQPAAAAAAKRRRLV
jgi:hypothetical protein